LRASGSQESLASYCRDRLFMRWRTGEEDWSDFMPTDMLRTIVGEHVEWPEHITCDDWRALTEAIEPMIAVSP